MACASHFICSLVITILTFKPFIYKQHKMLRTLDGTIVLYCIVLYSNLFPGLTDSLLVNPSAGQIRWSFSVSPGLKWIHQPTDTSETCSNTTIHLDHLDLDSAKLLAHALVSSRHDYRNSIFSGIADSDLTKRQHVQNRPRPILWTIYTQFTHGAPLLRSLH